MAEAFLRAALAQPTASSWDAFLDDGAAPVLVTLGTSAATGAAERFRLLRDGLAAIGHRSVVLHGSSVDVGPLSGRLAEEDGAGACADVVESLH